MANKLGIAWSPANLGYVVVKQEELDLAIKYFEEGMSILSALGDEYGINDVRKGMEQVNERACQTTNH